MVSRVQCQRLRCIAFGASGFVEKRNAVGRSRLRQQRSTNPPSRRAGTAFALTPGMSQAQSPPVTFDDRFLDLVAEKTDTPRETLDRETRLHELGDSLTRVETVMALEDEFEISLPDDVVDNLRSLGELIDTVAAAVRAREKSATDGTAAAPASP